MDGFVAQTGKSMASHPAVLALDTSGKPQKWLNWTDAATLICRGGVAWTAGENSLTVYGGTCRATGARSSLQINSIIAVRTRGGLKRDLVPSLSNHNLFARDQHLCLYCGLRFSQAHLSFDHILPESRGGLSIWSNAATACVRCNTAKGNRTPEEANMPLLAVPFVPSFCEHLILSNRRILADQMRYLSAHLPSERRERYL